MPKKVELVLPVYDEQELLDESVRHIISYLDEISYYDVHILISSNGSTDSTLDIARSLSKEFQSVSFTHHLEIGRGLALKKA